MNLICFYQNVILNYELQNFVWTTRQADTKICSSNLSLEYLTGYSRSVEGILAFKVLMTVKKLYDYWSVFVCVLYLNSYFIWVAAAAASASVVLFSKGFSKFLFIVVSLCHTNTHKHTHTNTHTQLQKSKTVGKNRD